MDVTKFPVDPVVLGEIEAGLTWYHDFAAETVGYSAAALGTCTLANVFSWVDHRLWLAMMAFTVSAWAIGIVRFLWGKRERERRLWLLVERRWSA